MYSIKHRKIYMYLLMLLLMYPIMTWASKPGTKCGQNGNLDTVCSPVNGETWRQNGTYYLATWNPVYPTYVSSASLSIYIYFVEHYQKINAMSFHNISNTGEYPIFINESWFYDSLKLQDSPKHEALFYLISSDLNPITEMDNLNSAWPSPTSFNVEASASPSTKQQGVATTEASPSSAITTPIAQAPWVTLVIVIGVLLLLLGCIVAFYVLRIFRRRKLVFDEKSHTAKLSSSSSDPFTKQQGDRQQAVVSSSYPNLTSVAPPPPTLHSMSNLSSRSDPPLTSTDAILIADTFRQRMRRPNWPHCSNIVQEQKSSETGTSEATARDDDEIKRQLASELLLKKELEAEGTLMKKVGKRAHLLSTIQYDAQSNSPV